MHMVGVRMKGSTAYMNIVALPSKRPRLSDAEKRAQLPEVLYELCNSQDSCLRSIILDHYLEESERVKAEECCSVCQPDLAELPGLETPNRKRKSYLDSGRHLMFPLLQGWCTGRAKKRWPNTIFVPNSRILVS